MPKGMFDNQLKKRLQREVEGIYGNEALTGDLDDNSAGVLLKWAEDRVRTIVQSTEEMDDAQAEQLMYPRLKALRRMARYINRALSSADSDPDWIEKVLNQARVVYGETFSEPDQLKLKALISSKTTAADIIQTLKHFIEGEDDDKEDDVNLQKF